MRRAGIWAIVLSLGLWGAAARAQAPASAPVAFARVVFKLQPGQRWADIAVGPLCYYANSLTWDGGASAAKSQDYFKDLFYRTVAQSGYRGAGDPTSLFKTDDSEADILIAGLVDDMHVSGCNQFGAYLNTRKYRGDARMHVEWQIYSRMRQQIVARVVVEGRFKTDAAEPLPDFVGAAFADAVRQLAASPELRQALTSSRPPAAVEASAPSAPLALQLVTPGAPVSIPDAQGSVVLIRSSAGQGSAFLVSADGYMLTDAHVVGESRSVIVKWPDGIENPGEVVRTDVHRDVALIKTDPRGRRPLAIRSGPLQPGDTVWALGAPYGMEATVTRGVVSNPARMFNNLMYIQSDVIVTHGNSGGPLLDEHGAVVGLTDIGYQPGLVQNDVTTFNLFTPIGDALDFLHLKTH